MIHAILINKRIPIDRAIKIVDNMNIKYNKIDMDNNVNYYRFSINKFRNQNQLYNFYSKKINRDVVFIFMSKKSD
jgi:hypothetical protein